MTTLSAMSHLRALVIQPCSGCQRNHCDCPDAVWLGIVPVLRDTTGIHAKAGDEAQAGRLKAVSVEPVSRAVSGRALTATSEIMDVTAGETAPISPSLGTVPLPLSDGPNLPPAISNGVPGEICREG